MAEARDARTRIDADARCLGSSCQTSTSSAMPKMSIQNRPDALGLFGRITQRSVERLDCTVRHNTMQAIFRLLPQTIVRGSSSRHLLTSRTTLGRVVAAPLAPCSSLPSLLSIRHKSASSFAANVDEPSATGDEDGAAEVPVLNTKGKGSLSQNTHSAKSQKMPPKHEKHRSQWTDEENFAEVLKRTPQLPQQSYTEEHFKNSIAAIAAKFRNIVDKRLALYERSDPCESISVLSALLMIQNRTDLCPLHSDSVTGIVCGCVW